MIYQLVLVFQLIALLIQVVRGTPFRVVIGGGGESPTTNGGVSEGSSYQGYYPQQQSFSNEGYGAAVDVSSSVKFWMYTRSNTYIYNGIRIYPGTSDLLSSGFNPYAPTKIIAHGFNSDYVSGPGGILLPAYFEQLPRGRPLNVILVDWSALAGSSRSGGSIDPAEFAGPARNTESVGRQIGVMIAHLVRSSRVSVKNIHLIGHSLGAHGMGYAGRYVSETLGEKVSRITALDPARPCFESPYCFGSYDAVRATDADFVDVIHTGAGTLGMEGAVGHADFYPNGGSTQPDCLAESKVAQSICDHRRSIELLRDSILNSINADFLALQCQDWNSFLNGACNSQQSDVAIMGENCSPDTRGVYFLKTS